MSEIIDNKQVFSLFEVSRSIQKTLSDRYSRSYWIKAEMNKLNHYSYSGHCYPELVEKQNGVVVAEIRSVIWKNDFQRINENFKNITKEPLKEGINILFNARIAYDPKYGISLHINEIDPAFTLGELEKEKKESIERLKKEGVYDKNKTLELPLLPKRIAIISVETSKGYADFLKVIDQNQFDYKFFHFLFPALLQGDRSVPSIIRQLRRVKHVQEHFDLVAIIRGGGGDVGLSSYNNYELSREICLFPLPVFTGIGHSTNLTVSELVAYRNAITPTELADFLIQQFHDFSVPVQKAQDFILDRSKRIVEEEKRMFDHTARMFKSTTHNILFNQHQQMNALSGQVVRESRYRVKNEKDELGRFASSIHRGSTAFYKQCFSDLKMLGGDLSRDLQYLLQKKNEEIGAVDKILQLADPINVLKRGYSISRVDGKAIRSVDELKKGSKITTAFADGKTESEVKTVQKSNNNE